MLYVSSIKDGRYYITDTSDGITECVDNHGLSKILKLGLKVSGVSTYNGKISVSVYNIKSVLASLSLQYGDTLSFDIKDDEIIATKYNGDESSFSISSGGVRIGN